MFIFTTKCFYFISRYDALYPKLTFTKHFTKSYTLKGDFGSVEHNIFSTLNGELKKKMEKKIFF